MIKQPNKLTIRTKTGTLIAAALLAVVSLALILNWRSDEEAFFSNIALFSLINLNILALLVLVVLVARNVIKLIFERRRGILGAKLRSRLVISFVSIALIPMTLSFIVSSGLIHQAVEGWFSTQIDSLVNSSLNLARQYVAQSKAAVRGASTRVRQELLRSAGWLSVNSPRIQGRLEELRQVNNLYSITIVDRTGGVINAASHSTSSVESFGEPPLDIETIKRVASNSPVLRIEERGASQFVRLYEALGNEVLVSSYRMDPEMVHAQGVVNDAFNQYGDLKVIKDPLRANFFAILGMFNLLTLFGAIWVAFFISKQITGPIQVLAEGTRSIARGDYSFKLPHPVRDDEVGYLMSSFNQMVADLISSRDEADRRGRLVEAIISNLGVGVVALDLEKRITAVNRAARDLLEIVDSEDEVIGGTLSAVVPESDYQDLGHVIDQLSQGSKKLNAPLIGEGEVRLKRGSRELLIVCTLGEIKAKQEGAVIGYVLLLDDVTELSRAQHLAAWRDVARRIAHEIKNPLTPLQLSAQRLERLVSSTEIAEAAKESVRSIVEHVEIIKRLANEFSEYGRMPSARFAPTDIEALIRSAYESFKCNHPEVDFRFLVAERPPEMLLDPEQIRGVLINILTNAVAAVGGNSPIEEKPLIELRLDFDRGYQVARLEISDNGPGIAAGDKNKVFEPYFTTKKGGTGLGLAIVSAVIAEHYGEVSIYDNKPRGARFVITLPQHPQPTTIRRLGVGR
jgi:two-component system nitrogen regulation sensor histidine kinase NtrY